MVMQTSQSIKPYRPEPSLRDRARLAMTAEQQVWAAQRAEALARATTNVAGSLVLTCRRFLAIEVEPSEVLVAVINEARTISARVIVESIHLSVSVSAADAAKLSGPIPLGTLRAEPHCPVCGAVLSEAACVFDIADLGRVLGEVGCGCGWEPSV